MTSKFSDGAEESGLFLHFSCGTSHGERVTLVNTILKFGSYFEENKLIFYYEDQRISAD
jgi:hypothetical protein